MELYQLRAFVATADLGQVTKAAQRLHITQPAVTAQIKALEQEIGVPLFERSGSGVQLTRAGTELLAHARNVLAASKAMAAEGKKLREGLSQELRLGTVLHPQFIRLGKLVSELLETFPLLQIKLRHGISGNVIEGIMDGDLDAAFYLGHQREPNAYYFPLAQLEYCIVGTSAWAKQIEGATLEQLSELPWLAAPSTSSQSVLLEQLFKGHSVRPSHIVEVDQETTRICLVLEGIGLCLMRKELAWRYRREGKIAIWEGEGPSTTLSFVHETSREDDLAIKTVREIVMRLWSDPRNTVDLDIVAPSTAIPLSHEVDARKGAR